MKNYIIGIAGEANSGKDTVASMINYIFAVGITNANFTDWIVHGAVYDNTNKDRIIHFADPLKDILSILYNIPRKYFDDRKYKDELYYCMNSGTFVEKEKIIDGIVCMADIESFGYNFCFNRWPNKFRYIKLRTLMQYIGTNIFREHLSDDIWIKSTISKIVDIAQSRRLCIVPDIRFYNEAKAIKFNTDSLYGGVIKINRKNTEKINKHDSEIINIDYDYIIDNNDNLMKLFYKTLSICVKVIK